MRWYRPFIFDYSRFKFITNRSLSFVYRFRHREGAQRPRRSRNRKVCPLPFLDCHAAKEKAARNDDTVTRFSHYRLEDAVHILPSSRGSVATAAIQGHKICHCNSWIATQLRKRLLAMTILFYHSVIMHYQSSFQLLWSPSTAVIAGA